MKRLFSTILLLLPVSIALSQSAYYDALRLRELLDSGIVPVYNPVHGCEDNQKACEAYSILKKYVPEDITDYKKALEHLDKNPLLGDFIIPPSSNSSNKDLTSSAFVGKALESVGGLNITNIADGLAKFLVERTKQELTITFFEKFKEELNEYEELKILFPKTHSLLLAIGDEIYNFSAYTNMLREAFQEDLKTIIPNLRTLIDSGELQKYLTINPTVKTILKNALTIAEGLHNGEHPGDIISQLKNENKNNKSIRNLSPSLETLDLMSQSLKSKQKNRYWISSDSLKMLVENDTTFKIYLGLIHQQANGIEFVGKDGKTGKSLRTILTDISKAYDKNKGPVILYIETLVAKAERVDKSLKAIKELNKKEGQRSGYSDHYEFYTASIDLIEHSLSIKSIPAVNNLIYFDLMGLKKYFEIAHTAGDLYLDVKEKNYFSAVINLNLILEKSIPGYSKEVNNTLQNVDSLIAELDKAENNDAGKKAASNALAFLDKNGAFIEGKDYFKKIEDSSKKLLASHDEGAKGDVRSALINIKNFLEKNKDKIPADLIDRYNKILPKLLKYGNLAASIAKAESSDEVEKIIESIALPAGSARIKRDSRYNIALNAYMGLYAGYENIEANDKHNYQFATGLSAPVGITLSRGDLKCDDKKGGKSVSLFLSLIDIGAVASFRFNDSNTESIPEIQLKDIISPGAFVVYGFGKIPLSLGAGYQIGPRLHEVSVQNNTIGDTYGRASLFIAVDIPIINFHTTPKEP